MSDILANISSIGQVQSDIGDLSVDNRNIIEMSSLWNTCA